MAQGSRGPQYGTLSNAPSPASDDEVPPSQDQQQSGSDETESRTSRWGHLKQFYDRNIGLVFVFVAQFFGSIMSMTTRLLETGFETKFHALQVIFARMIATAVLSSLYMAYKKTPGFPFGPSGVRWLLVLRGLAGSSGLFGLYYSLSYLDIADATVITFLIPTITAFVCWVALREPFTLQEGFAGAIAFAGVLFIARPSFIFPSHNGGNDAEDQSIAVDYLMTTQGGGFVPPPKATPAERSVAIVCAIFGAFCASTAYATIRVIGKRAHSLVSVNYFAVMSTLSSALILLIHPSLGFKLPQSAAQWGLLLSMGVSGFLLQVLLTEGLQREKGGRATNLIYVQLVFALIIERVVWGSVPPVESFVGGALIIGAAVWVSLQKSKKNPAETKSNVPDEEESLLPQEDAAPSRDE